MNFFFNHCFSFQTPEVASRAQEKKFPADEEELNRVVAKSQR